MYHYVIVGGGAAGCVLANRLSEDRGTNVLVLEAGPSDRTRAVTIPAAFPTLMRTERDWNYTSVPQRTLYDREIYHPRGRTLGGCSSINAQIYQRGHPADFDDWASLGNPGWGAADVMRYFARAEQGTESAPGARSVGGPMRIADPIHPNPMSRAFIDAAVQTGIAGATDPAKPEGVSFVRVTQNRGRRWSTADAYLRPAIRRANLAVRTGVRVSRVMLEAGRAIGVEYISNGATETVRADQEVILCSGVFNTPQLLMLSGIGPAERLRSHGIVVKHDLRSVGENLQDHAMVLVKYGCRRPISLLTAATLRNLLRYVIFRNGPLTSNVAEAAAFVRSTPDLAAPDLEILFGPVFYDVASPPSVHAFSVGAVLLHPRSTGSVALRSSAPTDSPVIEPAYLSDTSGEDLRLMVEAVKVARRIAHADALAEHRGDELVPSAPLDSDDALRDFVRRHLETLYHPVGTCRMGNDDDAVVDPELRLRGVDGLRIVDASIMPKIVRAHPMGATIMIAEKGADLIRRPVV